MKKRENIETILIIFFIMFCCFSKIADAQRKGGRRNRTGIRTGVRSKKVKQENRVIEINEVEPIIKYDSQKVDYVYGLLSNYTKYKDDFIISNNIINQYKECSQVEQDSVRSRLYTLIIDSLKAEHVEYGINTIENYKLIAPSDDEHLSRLVMMQADYYYNEVNSTKLDGIIVYMKDIARKSTLDYREELKELERMIYDVEHGDDDFIGYWVSDITKLKKADPFYIHINRQNTQDGNGITILTDYDMADLADYKSDIDAGFNLAKRTLFNFFGSQTSKYCERTSPKTLSYYWCSEDLKISDANLATALRATVRATSNSVIGELARSNSHSISTTLLGSMGSLLGEAALNALISQIFVSRKTIQVITGVLTVVDHNTISAKISVDVLKLRTDKPDLNPKEYHYKYDVDLIRCPWDDPYIRDNLIFISGYSWLRQDSKLSRKERKNYYKKHPEVRKKVRKYSNAYCPWGSFRPWKLMRSFNKEQIEKLKEYNSTH